MTAANDQGRPREGLNRGRLLVFLLALPVIFGLSWIARAPKSPLPQRVVRDPVAGQVKRGRTRPSRSHSSTRAART